MKEREIKFRAWIEDGVYENTMIFQRKPYMSGGITFGTRDDKLYFTFNDIMSDSGCHIMQYTGLKDRNGKEIYEGDILEYNWGDKESGAVRSLREIVEWKENMWTEEGFMTGFGEFWATPDQYEVIGNIYENPELLK